MKVKRILATFGVLFTSLIITGVASAVTFEGHSDVQFTFGSVLSLSLSSTATDCPTPYLDPTFCIEGLMQGNEALSNMITATVTTNNSAGYNLSATVGGTGLDGTSTYSTSELVSTAHTDKFTMIDDTVSTNLSAGEWGFTLSGDAVSPAVPSYMTLDTSTPKTINATVDNIGTAASGYEGTADTDMWIGAYADSTQKAGQYGNVINFTALANVQMRTVTVAAYDANTTAYNIVSVDGTPITATTTGSWAEGQVLGITATCAANKQFLGWGLSNDFGRVANQDAATTTYTVGRGNVTLTAYCGDYQLMQNFTAVNSLNIGETRTLKDARDGQLYTVAKLADGKVWMVENLNLAGGTKLYSETSDVPSGYPTSGGVAYYELPASSTSGFDDDARDFVYNSGNKTSLQSGCDSTPCSSYYSWLAATAKSGVALSGDGIDAPYSICPKGWRLPKAGNQNDTSATSTTGYKKGDFYKLATAYGVNLESQYYQSTTAFYDNAGPGTIPNFLTAGYYSSGSFLGGGVWGNYWSSSLPTVATHAYYLPFNNSGVYSAYSNHRYYGFSVRCVLQ